MSLKSSAGYGTIPTTTTTTTQFPQPPATTATSLTFISRATTASQTIIATRRPWSELLNRSSLSRPYSYGEAVARIKYNLNYFRKGPVVTNNNKGCYKVQCCSASSTSASSNTKHVLVENRRRNFEDGEDDELEHLVSDFGWKVRRLAMDEHEMREVAQIQAEAFHTPVALFDDLFFQFFKAEVLSGLLYKLRNSPPDRYACLVAEPAADSSKSQRNNKLVGIVDVTASRDEAVLQHLRGAEEYLYVSGIAVSKSFRRQKIGSVLLKASDVLSILWGFKYLVLRAYEDDMGARRLYTKAGYRVVSSDPLWMTWIGRKRRVLMIKQSNLLS